MKWRLYHSRIPINVINAEPRISWPCPFSTNRERARIPVRSIREVASPIPRRQRHHPGPGVMHGLCFSGDSLSTSLAFGPTPGLAHISNTPTIQDWHTRSHFSCSWDWLALEVWCSTFAGSPVTIARSTHGSIGTGSIPICAGVVGSSSLFPHNPLARVEAGLHSWRRIDKFSWEN